MAASAPGRHQPAELVDLLETEEEKDSDSDSDSDAEIAPFLAGPERMRMPLDDQFAPWNLPPRQARPPDFQQRLPPAHTQDNFPVATHHGGTIVNVDGEEVFIPDEDEDDKYVAAEADGLTATAHQHNAAPSRQEGTITTFENCLIRVLEIFPDISHEYVRTLYNEFDKTGGYETLPPSSRLDNIIEQLVSSVSYPKQEKGKKRKREPSRSQSPENAWSSKDRADHPFPARAAVRAMLKAEFPEIPVHYINETLAAEKHLYHAYLSLTNTQDDLNGTNRPYGRGRPSHKGLADADAIAAANPWPHLQPELEAARQRVRTLRAERAAAEAKKREEQENLERAIAAGETAECSACYEDLPMNRQLHCNGSVAHFACLDCMERYIKSEVGDSRCRVLCVAGCGASFAHNQLDLLPNKALLEKLAQLQQEKDIRDAELDDLEECPFCDYKAILPSIEEDFEFRCANPECEKVSCRRCKTVSHIPYSCEEHAKNNKANSRHMVEEAMTAALLRSCNKCKKPFVKDVGCNKMTCSSCGNVQCYVCSASVRAYQHFDQKSPQVGSTPASSKSKCPLYDNVEERHEREVKEAEAVARAKVVEENPDVTAEDLEIKMSDAVNKATADRIRRFDYRGIPDFVPDFINGRPGDVRAHRNLFAWQARGDMDDRAPGLPGPQAPDGIARIRQRQDMDQAVVMHLRRYRQLHEAQNRQVPMPVNPNANPQLGQGAWPAYLPAQPQAPPAALPQQLPQLPPLPAEPANDFAYVWNDLGFPGDGAADFNFPAALLNQTPAQVDVAPFNFNGNALFGQPALGTYGVAAPPNQQQTWQMPHHQGQLGQHQPLHAYRQAQQPVEQFDAEARQDQQFVPNFRERALELQALHDQYAALLAPQPQPWLPNLPNAQNGYQQVAAQNANAQNSQFHAPGQRQDGPTQMQPRQRLQPQ